MKKILLASGLIALGLAYSGCQQNKTNTQTTETAHEMTLREILKQRHSVRRYSDKALTDEQLMDVLWAANGVSRPNRRTAPSGVNAQDIELFVCSAQGVSKYNAAEATLEKVTNQDIRPSIAGNNQFVHQAPLTILLVTDQAKFGPIRENNHNWELGLMDAGIVSQNISLWCTAQGLGTVCCAPQMPQEELRRALDLSDQHFAILYHPVGYEAE